MLAAGVRPLAAQEVSPEACAGSKEQIRYLVNEGAFIQEASLKNGVDLLANAILLRNAACERRATTRRRHPCQVSHHRPRCRRQPRSPLRQLWLRTTATQQPAETHAFSLP